MAERILSIPPAGAPKVPVFGISEWQNYYHGDEPDIDTPAIIDECVEAHASLGIAGIVWEAGRATINYHSDLPYTTRQWELGDYEKWPGFSRQFAVKIMNQCCPLRRGLRLGGERGMAILGRLCMNRHYGTPQNIGSTSRFSVEHPEWIEVGKLGEPVRTRMCYAIPEVRQERLDILLEVQRIGVAALTLDFCRQMPVLAYHDAIVRPFVEKTGVDPRTIESADPAEYAEWFQFRADILTGFMRTLREETRRQEAELGRSCPVIARVPDCSPWLMVACGLDIEAWFDEDLIDATMLSPFPRISDDLQSHPEYHVEAAHRRGKLCIGGVGSKLLIAQRKGDMPDTPLEYACQVADRQYKAGVDAMSLYQTESLCRREYLHEMIRNLGDKAWIARQAEGVEEPPPSDECFLIGKDWHSNRGEVEGLDPRVFGNLAL